MKLIFFSLVVVGCFVAVKLLLLILNVVVTRNLKLLKENDYKEDLFFYVVLFSLLLVLGWLGQVSGILDIKDTSFFWIWVAGVLGATIPVSVAFVISPLYYFMKSKQKHSLQEQFIIDKYSTEHKFFILDSASPNAFASGVLPYTKVILLNKGIFEKLSNSSLQAIIEHEIGHIKLGHLTKLYFICLIWMSFVALLYTSFISPHMGEPYFVIYLAVFSGIFYGGGIQFVLGFFQKKYEKQADAYAAKIVGKIAVINALLELNKASNGRMERRSFNYPTLKQRILNVEALSD